MKKLLSAITMSVLLLPTAAFASAITLAPTSVATTEGKSFSVIVGVNPTSGKAYTVRANLSFDPTVLEFTGFSFAPKWMPLSQSGYDIEDNTKGAVVKTGGYPGGITSATNLGTATFRAKKTGLINISATTESLILDANNQNAVVGNQGSVAVTIVAVPATRVQTVTELVQTSGTATATSEAITITEAITIDNVAVPPQTAVALSSLDTILTLGTGSATVASGVSVLVLLLVGGGFWFWRRSRY